MTRRVQVPPVHRDLAISLELDKWVKGKKCPRESFYSSLDELSGMLRRITTVPLGDDEGDDLSDEDDEIDFILNNIDKYLAVAQWMIEKEQSVLGWLLTKPTIDMTKWPEYVVTASWLVLQRYVRDRQNGGWPPHGE